MPRPAKHRSIEEPYVKVTVHVPKEYVGAVIELCQERRGIQRACSTRAERVIVTYEMPLGEVLFDFYDKLKTARAATRRWTTSSPASRATWCARHPGQRRAGRRAVLIIHREALHRGSKLVECLKECVPRQKYEVAIQAGDRRA